MGLLDGKRAIVTGAGRGLGRAYAMGLAAAGAKVLVNDIDAPEAQAVVAEIRAAGGVAEASSHDVANWSAAKGLVDQCAGAFDGIEVLVNNAGLTRAVPIHEETEEGFDRLTAVNLKGTFAVTRHALDHMVPRRQGSILNVSSGAQAGVPTRSVYGATKGGVASATYSWAMELAEHGITVNGLSPVAETRMSPEPLPPGTPIPPHRSPEHIAPLVVYLASDEARWITGQIFRLSGRRLSLFSHPKSIHATSDDRGWTLEVLRERVPRELGDKLEAVGVAVRTYDYGKPGDGT